MTSTTVFPSMGRTEISSSQGEVFVIQTLDGEDQQVSFPAVFINDIVKALREAAAEAGDAS